MKSVNGPYNLIRIEGKINNINKIFYLFMDRHNPTNIQTECQTLRSTHIRNYLIDQFDQNNNKDRKIDFFLESFPDVSTSVTRVSGIYLDQMRTMFERMFNFDFKKNKVSVSKEFPNTRLHYIDIRSYFTFKVGDPFSLGYKIGDYIFNIKDGKLTDKDSIHIKDGLTIFHSQIEIIYNSFFSEPDNIKKVPIIRKLNKNIYHEKDDATNAIKYLTNKIRFVYDNNDVKAKINEIINTDMANLFKKFEEKYDQIYKNLYIIKYEDLTNLYNEFETIIMALFCLIVDLYFLRRSLDKNYVEIAVAYTGGYHTANYLKYLIQKFNFKITHVHYSKNKIQEINKKIKVMDNPHEILDLFLPAEKNFFQCIDVSNFPDNFS